MQYDPYSDFEPGVPVRHVGDAAKIPLPDDSVPCLVTSPPYQAGVIYPSGYNDRLPWPVYEWKVGQWAKEMARVLMPGGRAWVNVMPTVIADPRDPLDRTKHGKTKRSDERVPLGYIWQTALLKAGLSYRDTITWIQDSFDGACQWGSWRRPSAPNLRGSSEIILLFHKGPWKREAPYAAFKKRRTVTGGKVTEIPSWEAPQDELGGDWPDLVRNVWKLPPAHSTAEAPAAFPIELPARCIRLSTWPGELCLDMFAGSGTTGRACIELKDQRRCLLVDVG